MDVTWHITPRGPDKSTAAIVQIGASELRSRSGCTASVRATASESGRLKGILDYTADPVVSIDLMHTSASSTVDSLETAVLDGKLVRVLSWYDNEWGFSNRMVDTAGAMAKLI